MKYGSTQKIQLLMFQGKKTYPVSKLVCGRYVAAKSTDELWYRAQIRTLEPPGEPQVRWQPMVNHGLAYRDAVKGRLMQHMMNIIIQSLNH